MPVPTKFGVGVHFEVLSAFGVQCNSLLLLGLEVLH